ncbi:hypothetical protein LINPERHAP1_LOCUS25304 [Linum perenne]
MNNVLKFISLVDVSPNTYGLHHELLNFMFVAMSTQLLVVHRLLLNYITRPRIPLNVGSYPPFGEAANLVLLPFNYLVNSSGQGARNPLAECSLHVLLILNYYHKCNMADGSTTDRSDDSGTSDSLSKSNLYFSENPYCKALENNACMYAVDRVDIEKNAHNASVVRLPFASLFDTLGM